MTLDRDIRIVIDGPDGAGKSTLCSHVVTAASERWPDAEICRVPAPSHTLRDAIRGASLRDIVLHPDIYPIGDTPSGNLSAPLLHKQPLPAHIAIPLLIADQAATLWALRKTPTKAARRVVLFDRWTTSTLVYQGFSDAGPQLSLLQQIEDVYLATIPKEECMSALLLVTFDESDAYTMLERAHPGSNVFESNDRVTLLQQLKRRNTLYDKAVPAILESGRRRRSSFPQMVGGPDAPQRLNAMRPIEEKVAAVLAVIEERMR